MVKDVIDYGKIRWLLLAGLIAWQTAALVRCGFAIGICDILDEWLLPGIPNQVSAYYDPYVFKEPILFLPWCVGNIFWFFIWWTNSNRPAIKILGYLFHMVFVCSPALLFKIMTCPITGMITVLLWIVAVYYFKRSSF